MSFNKQLVHNNMDLQGNELLNAKPQHLDKHPNTLGLFTGFEYFNTSEKIKYLWNGVEWITEGGKPLTGEEVADLYESVPNKNAFTNEHLAKLNTLTNYNDTVLKADIAKKVDKKTGYDLSQANYTKEEKEKLASLDLESITSIRNRINNIEEYLISKDPSFKPLPLY